MKGIILAGGKGTRLYPMTKGVSKQLLPIYDKPLIYYPLSILMLASIKEVLIISTPEDTPQYERLLGNGSRLGMKLFYKVQDTPRGLADAFILGEEFIGDDSVCLILGDNVFFGQDMTRMLRRAMENKTGATIFGYPVKDARSFGVVEFDKDRNVISVEEKPENPKSNYAVPGLYFYDNRVIEIAKKVKPSARGEIEITAVNNAYLEMGELKVTLLGRGMAWLDTGTPSNMLKAAEFVEAVQDRQGVYVSCIEEIAWRRGFITTDQLKKLGEELKMTEYGRYLLTIAEEQRKMTILVTGGAGFIGSNFIYMLLEERPDWKVICVDALTYAANIHTLNEAFTHSNFVLIGSVRDSAKINSIFEKEHPDVVVNFAAESHVDRSIENPVIFLETNIIGTAVLMDACRKYGIERFHQVGTDEVYGDLPLDRPDLFFHEDTPIHTSSPYSTSKASADLLVQAYHRTYGLPVTISRCSNNYGPYQFPEKLIPLMINNASQDKSLPVYGQGINVRDWLYVKDHCYGILAVLEKGRVGEVYNLGGHNEKANIEIVKIILSELDKPESLITYVTDRKGHDQRYAIDPSKAMVELGWAPTTMFKDGIKLTIQWYKDHMDWMQECTSGEYTKYYEEMYVNR